MAPPSVYCRSGGVYGNAGSVRGCVGYIYAISTAAGTSKLFKISQADGSVAAQLDISDFVAVSIAVNADRTRIAIGAAGGGDGDDTVKVFDSSLSEVWGVSIPHINTAAGGNDVRFLSGGDVIFATQKVQALADQNTLYRLDASDGSTTWANRFPDIALAGLPTLTFNSADRISVDASDNIYAHGRSNQTASTDNLAKFNASGVEQWVQSKVVSRYGIAVSPTPYLFVAGTTSTSGQRRNSSTGATDTTGTVISGNRWSHDGIDSLFIPGGTARKYNEAFALAWTYSIGASSSGVYIDSDGDSYWSHGVNGSSNNITKLDGSGGLVWSAAAGVDTLLGVA